MALGDEGLGKVVGPTGFGALDLDESGAYGFAGGIRCAALNLVYDVRQTLVHFFFMGGIAAEKEIIHVEACQQTLRAHAFGIPKTGQGPAGSLAARPPLRTGR